MSFEPRFHILADMHADPTTCAYFACDNLEALDKAVGPGGRAVRDAAFESVVAWCTDQFGDPYLGDAETAFDRGSRARNPLPGQWRYTRRCIVVSDHIMATTFRMRWC
ncbi:MAG: hypothetical protein EOP89_14615 [Lysobacteraceae bacterium]|nr:MAG: hypothetical protein EOP89_14615 [Xanthomonadaceae bacterium]